MDHRRPIVASARRSVAAKTVALVGAVVLLAGAGCPRGKNASANKAAAVKSAIPDSADQVIDGLRAVLSDQGVSKGLLLSDTAYSYEDGTRLELVRVNLTFYTREGEKDGVLTSRAGTYNQRLSRIEARGDVIVKRDDGRTLTTQRLVYDQARNQIFTDSAFTLVEPSKQVSGIGFESDPRLTLFKCLRACKGVAPVQIPAR
ncbi:MAG: LPS export ABC transporter periplasmic protein LptC [Gemmatimonas sp.]